MAEKKTKERYGLHIDEVCSVCGKKILILSKGGYLYKCKSPTRYQCSEHCWRIEKGELKSDT